MRMTPTEAAASSLRLGGFKSVSVLSSVKLRGKTSRMSLHVLAQHSTWKSCSKRYKSPQPLSGKCHKSLQCLTRTLRPDLNLLTLAMLLPSGLFSKLTSVFLLMHRIVPYLICSTSFDLQSPSFPTLCMFVRMIDHQQSCRHPWNFPLLSIDARQMCCSHHRQAVPRLVRDIQKVAQDLQRRNSLGESLWCHGCSC